MTQRPDLSTYTTENLTVTWSVTFAGVAEYYVTEQMSHGGPRCQWGPVPSKETAYDLIKERRAVFEEYLIKKIPALRS